MKAMATLLGIGAIVVGCTVNSTTNNGGDSCSTSSSVTCEGAATGYSCTGTSVPSDSDATLDCSYGTADNGNTDYCCISLSSSVTCSQDTTVTGCQGDSYGFSCTGSDTPDQDQSGLNCSTGTAGNSGETLYCCTFGDYDAGTDSSSSDDTSTGDGSSNSCVQDSTVSCTSPAQGWTCSGSDMPQQTDASLSCSTGTAGSNGQTQYCCSN
jgi:hypothetical protein